MRAFDGEVAIAVAQLYLVHVFQRSIPAGFSAPRFPTTTTKTPVQRSTVARSTRLDLRWQQWCVRYRFEATTAQAQVIVDVSKITCDQFVHPKITTPNLIAAWLSGYYNAKRNNKIIDLETLEYNVSRVKNYCHEEKNFKVPIMRLLNRYWTGAGELSPNLGGGRVQAAAI
jgi:HdeA/HdeB family